MQSSEKCDSAGRAVAPGPIGSYTSTLRDEVGGTATNVFESS